MDTYNRYNTPHSNYNLNDGSFRYSIDSDDINNDDNISDISDNSELNDFIQNTGIDFHTIEGMRFKQNRILYEDGNLNNIEIDLININKYYKLNFLVCFLTSILFTSNIFMLAIIEADDKLMFIIRIVLESIILSMINYVFISSNTYKSMNLSLEFLAINWVFYEYSISTMLKYFVVNLLGIFTGCYFTIGMYYTKLINIDKKNLLDLIITTKYDNDFTIDKISLSIFIHVILIIGTSFILSEVNSINCMKRYMYVIYYYLLINLVYELFVGQIVFIMYKLGLYLSIISIFSDTHIYYNNFLLITTLIYILTKIIIYPLVAFYVKYVWKNKILRYLEYT